MTNYVAPQLDLRAFNCPHCGAFAAMNWYDLRTPHSVTAGKIAKCHHCRADSFWLDGTEGYPIKMMYPEAMTAPLPNQDMPEDCKLDYLEAREIANSSPRGAAALLRLSIQKLVIHLGGSGDRLHESIGELVRGGMPAQIQQALDIVRVIGNNAVHPGEINVEDRAEVVDTLFGLVNLIVDNRITQRRIVEELFHGLPEGARVAISRRDGN